MDRCGTCRWWKRNEESVFPIVAGECQLTEVHEGHNAVYSASKALAKDWESYYAILMTAEDFGCTQHEAVGQEGE